MTILYVVIFHFFLIKQLILKGVLGIVKFLGKKPGVNLCQEFFYKNCLFYVVSKNENKWRKTQVSL